MIMDGMRRSKTCSMPMNYVNTKIMVIFIIMILTVIAIMILSFIINIIIIIIIMITIIVINIIMITIIKITASPTMILYVYRREMLCNMI
jgi:hypothetical protein